MTAIKDLEVYCGYEIPKTTSRKARQVLYQLRRKGVVILKNDDGPGLLIRAELEQIAGAIGLTMFKDEHNSPYSLVIMNESHEKSLTINLS